MSKKNKKQEESEDYEEFLESSECECECDCECGPLRENKTLPTIYRG